MQIVLEKITSSLCQFLFGPDDDKHHPQEREKTTPHPRRSGGSSTTQEDGEPPIFFHLVYFGLTWFVEKSFNAFTLFTVV